MRSSGDSWLPFIVKSRQLADIQPCLSKDANMTLVAVPGPESRSVTHRDWRTLLRNSANNMLTRPPYDVRRANFADNPVGFRRLAICVLASCGSNFNTEPLNLCYSAKGFQGFSAARFPSRGQREFLGRQHLLHCSFDPFVTWALMATGNREKAMQALPLLQCKRFQSFRVFRAERAAQALGR